MPEDAAAHGVDLKVVLTALQQKLHLVDRAALLPVQPQLQLPKLKKQLAETTGLFKGKERKALSAQIERMQREIERRKDKIPGILKDDGYPDAQAFMRTYNKATELVEQYNCDLAAWERQVHGEQRPRQAPPEKESIRKKLREFEAEAKRRNDARRQEPLRKRQQRDYER